MASITTNELCKECQILVSKISCEPVLASINHHLTLESLEESLKKAFSICIELMRSLKDGFASGPEPLMIFFPIRYVLSELAKPVRDDLHFQSTIPRRLQFALCLRSR
jgi:hypothetical protein